MVDETPMRQGKKITAKAFKGGDVERLRKENRVNGNRKKAKKNPKKPKTHTQ